MLRNTSPLHKQGSKEEDSNNVERLLQLQEFNRNLNQLIFLQCQVNQLLISNKILSVNLIQKNLELKPKNNESQGSTLDGISQKYAVPKIQQVQIREQKVEQHSNPVKFYKRRQKKAVDSEESQYDPFQKIEINSKQKLCESKNIPKNYGKSIANFITKNETYIKKLSKVLNLDWQKLYQLAEKIKQNVQSIAELKSLWIQSEDNPFSQALRIITMEYLRKHSLTYIFCSRIQKFGKHLKYRQIISRAVQNPQSFTYMKNFW